MISEKVLKILQECKLTQRELSIILEVPLNRVKNLANGRVKKMHPNEIRLLAERLKINPAWLTIDEGDMYISSGELALQERCNALKAATQQALLSSENKEEQRRLQQQFFCERMAEESCTQQNSLVSVPIAKARLSAGNGSLETEDGAVGELAFHWQWLARKGQPDKMVLMRVTGDSMEPEIKHGDIVLIDQSQNKVIGGAIFAVGVEETVYIKTVDALPGQLILTSINSIYPPITVDLRGNLSSGVRIIGRVLWWCRENK